jgi:hypothetical protein
MSDCIGGVVDALRFDGVETHGYKIGCACGTGINTIRYNPALK